MKIVIMAYASHASALSLVCSFFLAFVTANSSDQKVVLGFYGESLCPDCIAFANGPLKEAFNEVK